MVVLRRSLGFRFRVYIGFVFRVFCFRLGVLGFRIQGQGSGEGVAGDSWFQGARLRV